MVSYIREKDCSLIGYYHMGEQICGQIVCSGVGGDLLHNLVVFILEVGTVVGLVKVS